ncbi:alpha/beta fold hydrolase [Paracoccaceae bacterium GXU_MW_L88]
MGNLFFTAGDGAKISYDDFSIGSGDVPLLCLAGLTRDKHDFDYLKRKISNVRLIRMDYRGRGESDWTGPDSYTVPQEAADALALLDHLGLQKAAILGTSRGGLIAMFLAATAKDRLMGICFNDVGPKLERAGLEAIIDYVGRRPVADTLQDVAHRLRQNRKGFGKVPARRWEEEAVRQYRQGDGRVELNYDPDLRESFLAAMKDLDNADAWPLFDACDGLPLALIHGANSDLLSDATVAEMQERRPDMLYAKIPDRAHIPFLDEPESVALIHDFLAKLR